MTTKRLRALIESGEGDTVEFKRKFTDFEKMAKEMIALANTRGGVLLLGVDDDGTVVGVASEKSEIDLIASSADIYCDPPVEYEIDITDIDGVDVIAVFIPESRYKPHRLVAAAPLLAGAFAAPANGNGKNGSVKEPVLIVNGKQNGNGVAAERVYIRQGEKSVLASKEVTKVLAASQPDAPPLRLEIGDIERLLFDYLERHPRITLREYRHLVNISQRRASRSLVRLVQAGLIRIFTDEREDYYTLS